MCIKNPFLKIELKKDSAYIVFVRENRFRYISQGYSITEALKFIAGEWRGLDINEKKKYEIKAGENNRKKEREFYKKIK